MLSKKFKDLGSSIKATEIDVSWHLRYFFTEDPQGILDFEKMLTQILEYEEHLKRLEII